MEDVRSGELLRIWWLFAWRFAVGSLVLSFTVGFVIGLVGTLVYHLPLDRLKLDAQIAGFVVTVLWGCCVIFMALNKTYRGFRVAIVRGELPLCRIE
jgi:ABC-type uncharacterized transport system permease subunit